MWLIRKAEQADYALILDSWLKSTRDSPWSGNVPNNLAMSVLTESVRQLVTRGAIILVAANPERPDQIVGWLCSEAGRESERIVHALYTKRFARRLGVAKALLAAVGLRPDDHFPYTYRTIMSRVFPNAKFVPGIQRRQKI